MICRVIKNNDYTVMSNYHLRDNNLSLKAKGLLSVVLSLPQNWNYSVAGLVSICKEKEVAITSALNELKENGYLIIDKIKPNKDNGGRWEYIYTFYEQSQKIQDPQILGVEILGVENMGLNKDTNKLNTDNNKLFNKLNNYKSTNRNLYQSCMDIIEEFCCQHTEDNLSDNLRMYLLYRLEVKEKPLYKNMWKGMLNKLVRVHEDNPGVTYADIIAYNLERGYLNFYPIRNTAKTSNNIHWQAPNNTEQYKRIDEKF